jgi:hypothetical protein
MNTRTSDPIEQLRQALLKMKATGPQGFEGFVGLVLGCITGIPYRLAASGLQGGVDADAAYPADHISFECKRYGKRLSRDSVLSKIADLSIRQDVDVWVLAGTTIVPSQLVSTIRQVAEAQGWEPIILDWLGSNELPPLGIACALVSDQTLESFLERSGLTQARRQAILNGIACLRDDPRFDAHAHRLTGELKAALLGIESMRRRNIDWLTSTFADRDAARRAFGQPLAPAASAGNVLPRTALLDPIRAHMTGEDNGNPLFVLGNEGVGKSWAVVQAWCSCLEPPAFFFIPPEALNGVSPNDASQALTATIARQCGQAITGFSTERWQRKLDRWFQSSDAPNVRFIIYLDGINQQQKVDWGRIIEILDQDIRTAGGRIVVSSRSAYFGAYVSSRLLSSRPKTVRVTEWTADERNEILWAHGFQPDTLAPSVLDSLRNPRLLGIATELLDNEAIQKLNELHIGRLLFEHLRAANRDNANPQPAHELVQQLSQHAKDLLDRVADSDQDDLLVFRDELNSVVEGHYFCPLEDNPVKYQLSDDGMRLALALAVLDHLQTARRNRRDLVAAALALIDPVAALDDVPGVLVAALSVSCADNRYGDDIRAALLIAFAGLQNPSRDDFDPFVALALHCPSAFMEAAKYLCLEQSDPPNLSWIKLAVLNASNAALAWPAISAHVRDWLCIHSLAPARVVVRGMDADPAEREAKLKEAKGNLETAIQAMTPTERSLHRQITEISSDPVHLHRLAYTLMAGKPLAPFADAIAAYALASRLDPNPFKNIDDLHWLGWFNASDWSQMHFALHGWVERLADPCASPTGKWAAVILLQLTGSPEDAARAKSLAGVLRPMPAAPYQWGAVQKSGGSDPCDPGAVPPNDLAESMQKMRDLPAEKLFTHFGTTSETLSFDRTLAIIARFAPEIAIDKIRALAADVVSRGGLPLRQGIIAAHRHSAVLTPDLARPFLQLRASELEDRTKGFSDDERQFLCNMCLAIACPHVSGDEQLGALVSSAPDHPLFLGLFDSFLAEAVDVSRIQQELDRAIQMEDERIQCHLLGFLGAIPMPSALETRILELCDSPSNRVRLYALSLLLEQGCQSQLSEFANGSWSAATAADKHEARVGSLLLVRAAHEVGVILDRLIKRISPETLGDLATTSTEGAKLCADLLDSALLSLDIVRINPPAVDICIETEIGKNRRSISLSTKKDHSTVDDSASITQGFKEDLKSYDLERQRNEEAFERFRAELASSNVMFLLHSLGLEEVDAIALACPERVDGWVKAFLSMEGRRKSLLKSVSLMLAAHVSRNDPETAVKLIGRYTNAKAFIRHSFGYSKLDLIQRLVWSSEHPHEFDAVRRARLDAAPNDQELSEEVLGAELWNQDGFLDTYVREGLASQTPIHQARAIAVCGFRNEPDAWLPELDRFEDANGFLESAYRSAKHAFQQNRWARHWHQAMCRSGSPTEFWSAFQLMAMVADVRVDVWSAVPEDATRWISLHSHHVRDAIQNRLSRLGSQREQKLFGTKRPSEYLPMAVSPGNVIRERLELFG